MKGNRLNRDREGFHELEAALVEHGNRFFRFAYGLCGSREDAEDLVEEAFLSACRNHQRIRDTEALVSWLYRIILNHWRMHRRKRRVPVRPLEEAETEGSLLSTDSIALRQAIAKLNPKQREALLLVKGEGLTLHEAASLLRRPVGTVASHVTQSMALLREELFPDWRPANPEPATVGRLNHELP